MLNLRQIAQGTTGTWLCESQDLTGIVRLETDSRQNCQGACFVAFEGLNFDAHNFLEQVVKSGAAAICVHRSPEPSLLSLAQSENCGVLLVEDTVKAYQNIASEYLRMNSTCKVLGITGSTGKTSVKSIISSLLEVIEPGKVLSTIANTNNHIGVPQNILRMKDDKFAILEMGTNNPGEIGVLARCAPGDIALITSIGDSHAGNFSEVDGILNEKCDIIRFMKKDGLVVLPQSCFKKINDLGVLEGKKYVTFGSEEEADYRVDYLGGTLKGAKFNLLFKDGQSVSVESSLTGAHQALNVAACCAVMDLWGYDFAQYSGELLKLQLPGMRMKVKAINGVTWINDAYNANPQSIEAFLDWLSELEFPTAGQRVLVLGDMLELGEQSIYFHKKLVCKLPDNWRVIAVGQYFSEALKGQAACFRDSDSAISALKNLQLGDVVALKGSRGLKLEKVQQYFEDI